MAQTQSQDRNFKLGEIIDRLVRIEEKLDRVEARQLSAKEKMLGSDLGKPKGSFGDTDTGAGDK